MKFVNSLGVFLGVVLLSLSVLSLLYLLLKGGTLVDLIVTILGGTLGVHTGLSSLVDLVDEMNN